MREDVERKYVREAIERLEKFVPERSKLDVSFMDDDKQTYVVATAHYKGESVLEQPLDATGILCIPIKDNKLDDDGLYISAYSGKASPASIGYYNHYTGTYRRTPERESFTRFLVYKEKGNHSFVDIISNGYVDVHNLDRLFHYVKIHRGDDTGKEAFDICKRFISPKALKRRRSSVVSPDKLNKYRKLRMIVKSCHAVGRCAGRLHRLAAREKEKKKKLMMAEELKKSKLARDR